MKLSDVMGHAGLSIYAQIALVLFLIAFAGVLVRTFRPSGRGEMEAARRLPLDDGDRGQPPAHDSKGAS